METFERIVGTLNGWVWDTGITIRGETLPLVVIALIGTGLYLTLYLGFVQIRRFAHGFAVTSGRYDDPDEPGDVSHFQALSTALSATVGIGNIAGVAIAIHLGGPGAMFWMMVCGFLGMATKYVEVTLAQRYRSVTGPDYDAQKWEGTVAGGPMYYIERGLGPKCTRPMPRKYNPANGRRFTVRPCRMPSPKGTPIVTASLREGWRATWCASAVWFRALV